MLAGCTTTGSEPVSLLTKTFKGKWDDVASSTFRITNSSQVRYCFEGECTNQLYTGDPNTRLRFIWGNARFEFKRVEVGYDGVFTSSNGQRSTVQMR
jgi:hypothetical protein